MPGADHGFERGIGMIVEAVVVAAIWVSVIEAGLIPRWMFVLFNIASIVGLVFLIDKTRYWSFEYLIGWLAGLFIGLDVLIQTEFLGLLDLLVYGGVAAGAIWLRVKIHT